MSMTEQAELTVKAIADHPLSHAAAPTLTAAGLAGAIAGVGAWLPYIAALLGICWYLIQMWESPWGQRQRGRCKAAARWLWERRPRA